MAAEQAKQKQEKENESKSFLDNIKTFKVDWSYKCIY